MKILLTTLFVLTFWIVPQISFGQPEKFIYKSGCFSGIDYMLIAKKKGNKKLYELTIDCNHFVTGIGKTLFIRKTIYSITGFTTFHLMKDSAMFLKMAYNNRTPVRFIDLSDEEYQVIKTAFEKYPALSNKYQLDAGKLKNYLGWWEVQ